MKYILLAIAVIALFFIMVMVIDVNRFVMVKYKVKNRKVKKPYKFVMLSDLHNKQFGADNEKLYQAICDINPDGVLIAGDMITAKVGQNMQPSLTFVKRLAAKYPVYYGQGNHEYRMELYPETYGGMLAEFEQGLKECNLEVMKNCHNVLEQYGIAIYGLSIERKFYKRFRTLPMEDNYIEGLVGKPEQGKYNILLAHNPDYYDYYDNWGADLVLSGHVHGGLMRLPLLGGVVSPAIRLFPKYDGGLFEGKNGRMILGRGLGTHTLPIRIFNPGELIVVELEPDED